MGLDELREMVAVQSVKEGMRSVNEVAGVSTAPAPA